MPVMIPFGWNDLGGLPADHCVWRVGTGMTRPAKEASVALRKTGWARLRSGLVMVAAVVLLLAGGACGGAGDPAADAVDDPGVSDSVTGDSVAPDAGVDVSDDAGTDPGTDPDAGADASDDGAAGDAAQDAEDGTVLDAATDVDDPFDVQVVTTPGGLPWSLPFRFQRADDGPAISDQEVDAFTDAMTGFWRQTDYFRWAAETSAGVDAGTGMPDYLIWWHDFVAVKSGDTVTFKASKKDGGSHNNAEPTGVVLANALVAHLRAPNDEPIRYLSEQYTKSFIACQKGFVFDEDDPVDWLFARNIAVTQAHECVMPWAQDKKKFVEYDEWFFPYTGWNADRFFYPDNPTWGPIWVTNKRSKDDLPYLYRVGAWLPYVAEMSPNEPLRQVAVEALNLLRRGARDIVESGWMIRTKDEFGQVYIPESEDLASFVAYTGIIPDAECDGRLSTALLGYGDTQDQDCGTGQGSLYDQFAAQGHYFNYDIINHFHQVAALLALTHGHARIARELVRGLAIRAERYQDPDSGEPGLSDPSWDRDIALFLLRSAAVGMPLTSDEARKIQQFHLSTLASYAEYPRWNLWDPSVEDGTYSFRENGFHPQSGPTVMRAEDMATLIEYCGSPFRNPDGARFIDCDKVLDPMQWAAPQDPES